VQKMKLEDQMRSRIRLQGKSKETFTTYWHWCARFVKWLHEDTGKWIHPKDVGKDEVTRWLTFLATKLRVAKNTQNLALQSVCYMYREILHQPLEGVAAIRSKRPEQARQVIDESEVIRLFDEMSGVPLLVSHIMYGCGPRIGEVANLRIKDISFERCQLYIHSGKGDKGRHVPFPECLHDRVRTQIESMRVLHKYDLEQNHNGVSLPGAYRRKSPKACLQFGWYYLFCSGNLSRDEDGLLCRHHMDKSHLAREIKSASERAGIEKRVTSHILRHTWATHSNEQGVDMRTIQVLMGHKDIRITEGYVHANKNKATAAKSPLESILEQPNIASESRKDNSASTGLRLFVG
jgi:integron integrase